MYLQKRRWEAARMDHLESDQKVTYLHLLVLQPVLALARQAWLPKNLARYEITRDQRSIIARYFTVLLPELALSRRSTVGTGNQHNG